MSHKTIGTPVSIAPVVPQEVTPSSDPRDESRKAFIGELTEKGSSAAAELSSSIQLLLKETKAEETIKKVSEELISSENSLKRQATFVDRMQTFCTELAQNVAMMYGRMEDLHRIRTTLDAASDRLKTGKIHDQTPTEKE